MADREAGKKTPMLKEEIKAFLKEKDEKKKAKTEQVYSKMLQNMQEGSPKQVAPLLDEGDLKFIAESREKKS
jgi:hypothetical protein